MNRLELEKILIESVYSNKMAQEYMMEHLNDNEIFYFLLDIIENSDSGDARMESSYYISKFDESLLKKEEEILLKLMDDEIDSVAVHIMIALSKIGSSKALIKIIENRIKPVLEWEAKALEFYFLEKNSDEK